MILENPFFRNSSKRICNKRRKNNMGSSSVEAINSESIFLSPEEVEEFDSTYEELITSILKETDEMMPDMKILADRLVELLNYNVCGGKKIR